MKFTGSATMQAPPDVVFAAFNDPAVLARTVPGCSELTELGPDRYAMTVTAGVAAIKGTYQGEVALLDGAPPSAFTLRAKGSGGPGTVSADVAMRLLPSAAGGTDLTYEADAMIGGTIGGVGQRMLNGVAKKMAGQFFAAVDADIASGGAPAGPSVREAIGGAAPAATGVAGAPTEPRVFPGRAAAPAGAGTGITVGGMGLGGPGFAVGAVIGGLLALAGVLIGARIARRG